MTTNKTYANGAGGTISDSEWDLFFGPNSQLKKKTQCPIYPDKDIYKQCSVLVSSKFAKAALERYDARYIGSGQHGLLNYWNVWHQQQGQPDKMWMKMSGAIYNGIYERHISVGAAGESLLSLYKAAQAAFEQRKQDAYERRHKRKLEKIGLSAEENEKVNIYKHIVKNYFSFETRRPDYLLKIDREIELFGRAKRMLLKTDSEFLEAHNSLSDADRRDLSELRNGDIYNWLSRRYELIVRKNETEKEALELMKKIKPEQTSEKSVTEGGEGE